MEPGAKLVLNLKSSAQPELDGWWLQDASWTADGVALIIAVRPDVAARFLADPNAAAPTAFDVADASLAMFRGLIDLVAIRLRSAAKFN